MLNKKLNPTGPKNKKLVIIRHTYEHTHTHKIRITHCNINPIIINLTVSYPIHEFPRHKLIIINIINKSITISTKMHNCSQP